MTPPASVDDYLADKNAGAAALFREFQQLVEACGPVEVSVSRTVVYFKRQRVFAGAHVHGRRLEVVIDLLRDADHPCAIGSFASTKTVISNRLRIREPHELDESIEALLREAYADVGPGTRARRA